MSKRLPGETAALPFPEVLKSSPDGPREAELSRPRISRSDVAARVPKWSGQPELLGSNVSG